MTEIDQGAELTRAMTRAAAEAIETAATTFGVMLELRDASLPQLDALLAGFAADLPRGAMRVVRARPPEAMVASVVRTFGALFGEIVRAEFGGVWVLEVVDGRQHAFLDLPDGVRIDPPGLVHRRLTQGAEHSTEHLVAVLRERLPPR